MRAMSKADTIIILIIAAIFAILLCLFFSPS